jgi:tetratricopeptide (TPR) repeat protein
MGDFMKSWHRIVLATVAAVICIVIACQAKYGAAQDAATKAVASGGDGVAALDEALRARIEVNDLRDLNRVILLVESALEKGLDDADEEFAQNMLCDTLMERATKLMQVFSTQPLQPNQAQQIRNLVTSDLRRVLTYDNSPAEAHLMLGRLLALPAGDPYEARRILNGYLEREDLPDENQAEALALRGRLAKDPAKSLADFEEAIRLVPENENYQLVRALLLRAQNKIEESLAAVDEILEHNPDAANALILQGEIYRVLKRPGDALTSFDSATELIPQAPGPYQNRGEIYREQGHYDKAVEQFSKVLEYKPGVLLTLVHRAEAYLNDQKPELALADSELVLEKKSLIAAHRIRAAALSKLDRLDEAIIEMEQLAEAIPREPELRMQLALYYLVDQQLEKAVSAYSEVLEIDGENVVALRSRGDTYLNFGKHAEAIADFEQALSLQKDDTSLLNNLAWVLATSPDDQLRDGKRAIELAAKACELTEHKQSHILSTLAAAYAESGNFESAIEWSKKSVEMNDPEHCDQLKKELESYSSGKPWRERQSIDKEKTPPKEPLTEFPQAPPNDAGQIIEQEPDWKLVPLKDLEEEPDTE